jgi:hypothetical protein
MPALASLLAIGPAGENLAGVTPRHVRAPPRTPRRANRFGVDLRVLRLARAVNRPAEGVRRKIFLAW